jgi:hypothetical protein
MTDEYSLSPDALGVSENRWKPPPAFKPARPTGDSPLPDRSPIRFSRNPRARRATSSAAASGGVSPPSSLQNSCPQKAPRFETQISWDLGFRHSHSVGAICRFGSFPGSARVLGFGAWPLQKAQRTAGNPCNPASYRLFFKKIFVTGSTIPSPKWRRPAQSVGGHRHFRTSLDSLLRFASLCVHSRFKSSVPGIWDLLIRSFPPCRRPPPKARKCAKMRISALTCAKKSMHS